VLQPIRPFFTPEVEKGARWANEISDKLEECMAGLIFLTEDNLTKPWILFEAGAISKSQVASRVYTLLIGITPAHVGWPLAQFQATVFGREEIHRLVRSLNGQLGENALAPDVLEDTFETWWPQLERQINEIIARPAEQPQEARRTTEDVLNDILVSVRSTEGAIESIRKTAPLIDVGSRMSEWQKVLSHHSEFPRYMDDHERLLMRQSLIKEVIDFIRASYPNLSKFLDESNVYWSKPNQLDIDVTTEEHEQQLHGLEDDIEKLVSSALGYHVYMAIGLVG
jgi:hypothetical protein